MRVSLFWEIVLFMVTIPLCTVVAQENHTGVFNQPVMPGPEGVWIFVYDSSAQVPSVRANTQYVISRDDQRGRGFKKLTSLTLPSSAGELEQRLGNTLTQEILRENNMRSTADLFASVQSGQTGVFGSRLLSPVVLRALGMLYVDTEIKKRGAKAGYRIERVQNGNQETFFETQLNEIGYEPFPRFRSQLKLITDSTVMVTWFALSGQTAFADVIDVIGKDGKSPTDRIWVYHRNDTLFATYSKVTRPGEHISLCIRPVDLAGNKGEMSDTVNLIAASFGDRLMVNNLKASDTLGGILLTWDRLPSKAWFTGIRILKSRSATDNFILTDTVSIATTQWLDRKIITGVQYYYIVEPLAFNLPQSLATTPAHATMHARTRNQSVMTPQGVSLNMTPERNVRISWMPNSELNVFAYYVMRGTSRENLAVISEGIRDTVYVDSLRHLHGGVSYQYAVIATDMDLNSSDTSALVSLIPPKARSVPSVAGLSARYSERGVRLSWNNVGRTDASVVGYVVYIRKKGDEYFTPVADSIIQGTFFIDPVIREPGVYEYGCTAVDAWSNQSILSTLAEVTITGISHLYPPADFDLRNTTKGIEIRIPGVAGEENAVGNRSYVIYRRLADGKSRWQRIGETTLEVSLFVDQKVVRDQLYVYAISVIQPGSESVKSAEKSIRRK